MSVYRKFVYAGVVGTMVSPAVATAQSSDRPNIILIMTDQQRGDAMGCTSQGVVISPNLDALARDGYLFTSAYSSVPSSTPARAGLLTGCSPWVHGMLGYGDQAQRYEHEMPSMLKDLGYAAMAVGKMHYYPQNNTHNYDVVLFDESGRHTTPYFESDYRKWFYSRFFGENPDKTGITWNEHRGGEYRLPEEVHPTHWTADRAIEMIEGYRSGKPLYLKVSFARPHSPYDPPRRFVEMYTGRDIPVPAKGDWVPESWREQKRPEDDKNAYIGNFGDTYACNSRLHYYASITFIDEQIGRVIDALKRKGMYDNSLIIFLSDHGDMLGDHCLWRKTYPYEGSAAIPFIVKLPDSVECIVAKGSEIDAPVELRDVLPTCLDINGAEQPAGMDGFSVLELLQNSDPVWREYIDLEHARIYWHDNYWTALTDGRMKYIWLCTLGCEQLFDLQNDPEEEHNLADDPAYEQVLDRMRRAMVEHLEIRGPEWVEDGRLVVRKDRVIYGPNFPEPREKK